jgi:hypothetical protein
MLQALPPVIHRQERVLVVLGDFKCSNLLDEIFESDMELASATTEKLIPGNVFLNFLVLLE